MEKHLACGVCLDIATDALESQCCHSLFCEQCQKRLNRSQCHSCCARNPSFKPNYSIRRIVDSLPIACPDCMYETTRGNLRDHHFKCPKKAHECKICKNNVRFDDFAKHIASEHHLDLIRAFSSTSQSNNTVSVANKNNIILPRRNDNGDLCRIGTTGKYYCGNRSLDCDCCDGECGPRNGCNCTQCMKLDISARSLPSGYLVNREGRICGKTGSDKDTVYCGAMVLFNNPGTDGYCGPDNGPQCRVCEIAQQQWFSSYSAVS
ncbi:hypothetical protein P9112_001617 [Eukaryota sp. TZLM1-RC]